MRRRLISTVFRHATAVSLLLTSCGCPPQPPSQVEQRASIPSHWITMEPTEKASGSKLGVKDAEAIRSRVPVVVDLITERVHSAIIRTETSRATATLSGTGPSYLQFLTETAGAEMKARRFLEAADSKEAARVIVLDEKLAERMFAETDPIGRRVPLGNHTLAVIGVVTQFRSGRSGDFTRDAYLPFEMLGNQPPGTIEESPESLDRICLKVDRLDQIENTKTILRRIIYKLHPNNAFTVQ